MRKLFSPRGFFLSLAVLSALMMLTACGGAAATPAESTTAVVELPATALPAVATPTSATPVIGGDEPLAPALPEYRRLTLEYPSSLKAGSGSDVIRLTLEVDALGNITPTAEIDGNVVVGKTIEIPNVYATHNVTAEAYFDVVGLDVAPKGSTFQPLKQGKPVMFTWSIGAQDVGTYRGTIWLFLNFENLSTGETERSPISAQVVDIKAVDLFGFSSNFIKTSGVVGSAVGAIVGFPFLKEIGEFLYTRLTKKKKGKSGNTSRKK